MSERSHFEHRPINAISTNDRPGREALVTFLFDEAMTSGDFKQIAHNLAQYVHDQTALNPNDRQVVIAEILGENDILNSSILYAMGYQVTPIQTNQSGGVLEVHVSYKDNDGKVHQADLELSEISHWLNRMRKEIQRELALMDEEDIHVSTGRTNQKAQFLHTSFVDKRPFENPESYDIRLMKRALDRLYTLPERSPYLLYPETTLDVRTGRMLQQKMNFITLQEAMYQEPPPELSRILGWLADALEGLIFLKQHGLMMSDLDPTNIAIKAEAGTAAWFDYEGIREEGDLVLNYFAKMPYIPPYRLKTYWKEQPMAERDMIYELGVTLEKIRERYQPRVMGEYNNDLLELEKDMRRDMSGEKGESLHLEEVLSKIVFASFEIEAAESQAHIKPLETQVYPPVNQGQVVPRTLKMPPNKAREV